VDSAVLVRDLGRRYGQTQEIDDLHLELGSGVTGLPGPNGAGKTTLLRCLATVLAPNTGEVEVFGLNPAQRSQRTELRRRIGYLQQDPGLLVDPSTTIDQALPLVGLDPDFALEPARGTPCF
jgi:ABC-2 type transport system ATP-binding protein